VSEQGSGAVERVVVADASAAAARAAELFVELARRAVAERGRFVVALAGGSTPKAAYGLLAGDGSLGADVWGETHVWFGDERCVPPDAAESNYRMAREALLARVPVPEGQVHRIEGERAPEDAAARYDALLRGEAVQGRDQQAAREGAALPRDPLGAPVFDLVLLGVGPDGHTASLFPGTPGLEERARWAIAVSAPTTVGPHVPRVTLTFPCLNSARTVAVLAVGAEKREAVGRALGGGGEVPPSGRVRGRERTVWVLDEAAAG
jgi:6-phosphogluconolactonase